MTYSIIKNDDNQVVCHFCNKICYSSPSLNQDSAECHSCGVVYYIVSNKINRILFKAMLDSKLYKIEVLLEKNKSQIYLYKFPSGYDLITSFNYILNIEPKTVYNKLKTYLLLL